MRLQFICALALHGLLGAASTIASPPGSSANLAEGLAHYVKLRVEEMMYRTGDVMDVVRGCSLMHRFHKGLFPASPISLPSCGSELDDWSWRLRGVRAEQILAGQGNTHKAAYYLLYTERIARFEDPDGAIGSKKFADNIRYLCEHKLDSLLDITMNPPGHPKMPWDKRDEIERLITHRLSQVMQTAYVACRLAGLGRRDTAGFLALLFHARAYPLEVLLHCNDGAAGYRMSGRNSNGRRYGLTGIPGDCLELLEESMPGIKNAACGADVGCTLDHCVSKTTLAVEARFFKIVSDECTRANAGRYSLMPILAFYDTCWLEICRNAQSPQIHLYCDAFKKDLYAQHLHFVREHIEYCLRFSKSYQ